MQKELTPEQIAQMSEVVAKYMGCYKIRGRWNSSKFCRVAKDIPNRAYIK